MGYKFVNGLTGSDTNDGNSWATAYKTLDKAWYNPKNITNHAGPIVISPGIYTLELPSTERIGLNGDWQEGLLAYGVGGGPVIQSLSVNTAFTMLSENMKRYKFVNATFRANTLSLAQLGGFRGYLHFSNCGLANGALTLLANVNTTFSLSHCRFEGSVPVLPVTPPVTADFINLNGFSFDGVSLGASLVLNCTGAHGFTPSGHMQGLFLYPQEVQYDSFGPTFRSAESVMADGMAAGLVSYEEGNLPTVVWNAVDTVRNERFTEWVADPTLPATFNLTNCNSGTLLSPAAAELTSAIGETARLLSPVMYYPLGVTLTQIVLQGQEFEVGESRQVLDSTPETSARTVEFRFSDSPFTQLAESPSWITVERGVEVGPYTGKYLQYRVTFALNAVA